MTPSLMAKLAAVAVFAIGVAGCASGGLPWSKAQAPRSCYWMTPDGSRWEPWPEAETKRRCFELDSCSGGEGQSGGGCYKWARSAAAPGATW